MSKIHILPPQVINQIAAGEVVERPASVIKELVENSLDAESTFIVIEIEKGGIDLVRITDNGCGMSKEDAVLCFEKHATSKIADFDDLNHLNTLGFRGEALSSVASVSIVELKTKQKEFSAGTFLMLGGGNISKNTEVGCQDGTELTVKSIFYNVPARRKFLKTVQTEFGHILSVFNHFALFYPHIHFRLIHNKKMIFDLPTVSDFRLRVSALLGSDLSSSLIPIFLGHKELHIEGFITKPQIARNTKDQQFLSVNGRQISNGYISHAVKVGYDTLLPEKKHPVYILKLDILPELADFNIHPRKLEVRFTKQQEVYYLVKEAVKKALEGVSLEAEGDRKLLITNYELLMKKTPHDQVFPFSMETSQSCQDTEKTFSTLKKNGSFERFEYRPNQSEIEQALDFSKELGKSMSGFVMESPAMPLTERDHPKNALRPLAQSAFSYIICESEEGIIIIDQHAAHERIMRMKLEDTLKSQEKAKQMLLIPLNIELSHREVIILQENLDVFGLLGFEIEEFGGNSFNVNAIPSFLNKDDILWLIKDVLDDLLEEKPVSAIEERQNRIINFIACRSAVKFGNKLTFQEQSALVQQLEQTEKKYTCPHGRPTMIKLTFDELEKRFGRR